MTKTENYSVFFFFFWEHLFFIILKKNIFKRKFMNVKMIRDDKEI